MDKKQYNYNKDLYKSFTSSEEVLDCQHSPSLCTSEYIDKSNTHQRRNGEYCRYLYVNGAITTITDRDKSQRFLTALILSLFVCLANIGLALFGFLIFRKPDEF